MNKCSVLLFFPLGILMVSGCTTIIQPALVPNRNVDKWPVVDPNDYGIEYTRAEDGSFNYSWSSAVRFDPNHAVVPFRKNSWFNPAAVYGSLNGKEYYTLFDTGVSPNVLIEDIQINRHRLPVFFFNSDNKTNSAGLAFAHRLRLGPIEYENAPCSFMQRHAEHRLFGLVTVHRFEWILVPLDFMCAFGHVEYDLVANELRFSETEPFTPPDPSAWLALPFQIHYDNVRRVLLNIPLEGLETTLYLDTGASYDLELRTTLVERLYEKRPDLRVSKKHSAQLYGPYDGGLQDSDVLKAKNFCFAGQTLGKVSIYCTKKTENAPLFDGTIGIGLFTGTIMVLDFKQNLMWVKKQKGSRFDEKR